jgi:HK97 family phage major capsid protein
VKLSRNITRIALLVVVALVSLPMVIAFGHHLSGDQLATGLLLANAPVAATEVKQLLDKIMQRFEDFKTSNDERLAKVEKGLPTGDTDAKLAAIQADVAKALDLKKDLELLESKQNVAGLLGGGHKGNPDKAAYKTAFFDRFVRKGDDDAQLKELQKKAWSVGTPADGGYALPEDIDRDIEKLQRDISPIRGLANVVRTGTSDYKKLVNVNGIASGWVGETAARTATNTSQLAEVPVFMGELYANPQITQQALDDLFFDVEAEIQSQLLEEFANKPKGFLAYTTAATADSSRAFGTLEHIATGVSGDFAASNKADIFYDTLAKLKAGYRAGSQWVMNKGLLFEVMKLKDTTGQYLWQPRLTENGLGIALLGYGVTEAEDMPAKAASSLSIAFGNFKRGYTIVDRIGMRMLRDPYSNKPYVGFYTTKRVGGMVVNSEAIKLIKFATS